MSVAASLRALRAPRAPSDAPTLPLAARAAAARNSLQLLRAVDPVLPTLERALHLHDASFDRATLPPPARPALHRAILALLRRLGPLFPLRPARALVDWLLHVLRVCTLGPPAELDALLLCALPHHATPHFAPLARHALRAPHAARCAWLRPLLSAPRIDPALLAARAPLPFLRALLAAAAAAAADGVAARPHAALIANVVARRAAAPDPHDRRALALACAAALPPDPDLAAAHLACLAAAAAAGLDRDALRVAARAAAQACAAADPRVASTAVALLAVCLRRDRAALPSRDARALIRDARFAGHVACVGDEKCHVYAAVVACVVGEDVPNAKRLRAVADALQAEHVLDDAAVQSVVCLLLDRLSDGAESDAGNFAAERAACLASILTALGKGRFANAVDAALRAHLNGRKQSHHARYKLVDDAIAKASEGTTTLQDAQVQTVDGSAVSYVAQLSHPESAVRRHALGNLSRDDGVFGTMSERHAQELRERLTSIATTDDDIKHAALAVECLAKLPESQVSLDLLRAIVGRCKVEQGPRLTKSKRKRALVKAALFLTEKVADKHPMSAQALAIGFVLSGFIPKSDDRAAFEEKITALLTKPQSFPGVRSEFEKHPGESMRQRVEDAVATAIFRDDDEFSSLYDKVVEWDSRWGLRIASLCLAKLSKETGNAVVSKRLSSILEKAQVLMKSEEVFADLMALLISHGDLFCCDPATSSVRQSYARVLWSLGSTSRSESEEREVLRALGEQYGLKSTIALLRDVCFDNDHNYQARCCSLKWYLSLCMVHPDPDIWQEAIMLVIRVWYGPEASLRAPLLGFCSKRGSLPEKKRERKSVLWGLLKIIANLPENFSFESGDAASTIASELRRHVLDTRLGGGISVPPLRASRHESSHAVIIEEFLVEKLRGLPLLSAESLWILRALDGFAVKRREDQVHLFGLLMAVVRNATIEKVSRTECETLARVTALVVTFGPDFVPVADAEAAATELSQVLQSFFPDNDTVAAKDCLGTTFLCLAAYFVTILSARDADADQTVHYGLTEALLVHSVPSTSCGASARRILESLLASPLSLNHLQPFVDGMPLHSKATSRNSKRPRPSPDDAPQSNRHVREKAALGAVEVVRRRATSLNKENSTVPFSSVRGLLAKLWAYVQARLEETNKDDETVHEDEIYQLVAVLESLSAVYGVTGTQGIPNSSHIAEDVNLEALVDVAFKYGKSPTAGDPLRTAVERASLDLLEILIPACGNESLSILTRISERVVSDEQDSLLLEAFKRVIPALVKAGNELQMICHVVTKTIYSSTTPATVETRRLICEAVVASQEQVNGNARAAVCSCLETIYGWESQRGDTSDAALEISRLLRHAGMSCVDEVAALCVLERGDCHVTGPHLLNASFLSTVAESMDQTNTGNVRLMNELFAQLFLALLNCHSDSIRDEACRALLATLPLPSLEQCVMHAMSAGNEAQRPLALQYVIERFNTTTVPLTYSWGSLGEGLSSKSGGEENDREREMEESFLQNVGKGLCERVSASSQVEAAQMEGEAALEAISSIAARLGSRAHSVILGFAEAIMPVSEFTTSSENFSSAKEDANRVSMQSKALFCLASLVSQLGRHAVQFVPPLLDASLSTLETALVHNEAAGRDLSRKQSPGVVTLIEAAIRVCMAVLESCPNFFGVKALRRVSKLAALTELDVLEELYSVAVQQVPANVFASALNRVTVAEDDLLSSASVGGICSVMSGVARGVECMRKSEVKVHWRKVLNFVLRSLEYCRGVPSSSEEEAATDAHKLEVVEGATDTGVSGRASVEENGKLDDRCAEIVTGMVLKLSESAFEEVFNYVVQWLDGGGVPREVWRMAEESGLDLDENVLRAVPFYTVLLRMLKTLRSILVPYFVQVLERIMTVISRRRNDIAEGDADSAGGRKRKTADRSETERRTMSLLCMEQERLRELCLENLALFLRQDNKSMRLQTKTLVEIQEALVSAFDQHDGVSERVAEAFCALATHMATSGAAGDSKEERAGLLTALARALLARTQEAGARRRGAALETCRRVAMAVGDEFLVALPESMPALAEVIDDEDEGVRRAAHALVRALEALAGEPILEQLQ